MHEVRSIQDPLSQTRRGEILPLEFQRGSIRDPAQFPWHEVTRVQHYYLNVDAMIQPMQVREDQTSYGTPENEG